MYGKGWTCRIWLEMAGIPEMAGDSWTWLEVARTDLEVLEIAGMAGNG